MSKNIYKYKIRYTNILGGSSSINENQEANNQNDILSALKYGVSFTS